jgi:thymidylate synthase
MDNQNLNIDDKFKTNLQNTIIDSTRDLGPIYGWQWNHFGGAYSWNAEKPAENYKTYNAGVNQIKDSIEQIRKDKNSRRAIVSAVNPADKPKMGLEPCHLMYHILVTGDKLNLIWTQRSCDMFLGVPYNIASYALLLLLYAKELGYKPGILRGELHDVHIYENHIEPVKEQLSRKPFKLPTVEISDNNWNGLQNWSAENGFMLKDYVCYSALKAEVAR